MTKTKQTDFPDGVVGYSQLGQPIVYAAGSAPIMRQGPVPSITATMTMVQSSPPKKGTAEVEGRRRPLSRDDLAVWYEEARRTLKSDRLPPEFFQVRGATSSWPDIFRSRAEIDAAERGRRELAMGEGRGQTDRAALPKARPSAGEIERLILCLGWTLELKVMDRRRAVMYRLCGRSWEAIGADGGVSHTAIQKRYAKGLDDIWTALSTSAPKS